MRTIDEQMDEWGREQARTDGVPGPDPLELAERRRDESLRAQGLIP